MYNRYGTWGPTEGIHCYPAHDNNESKKQKIKKKKNRFTYASAYSNMVIVGDYCWIDIQVLQEPYQKWSGQFR